MGPGLFWGWGWLALVGVVILFGLMLIPWFFFLLHLQTLLGRVTPESRRMRPGRVWLNYIPVFNLGWFIYTVIKVRESAEAEFETREWPLEDDLGYNVGLTAGILWVASFFIGWIPFFGWMLALAGIICWIIYWLKAASLEARLNDGPAWNPASRGAVPAGYGPYVVRYPPGYVPPEARPAGAADDVAPDETTVTEDESKPAEEVAAAETAAAPETAPAAPRERRKTDRRTGDRRKRAASVKKPAAPQEPTDDVTAEAAPADSPAAATDDGTVNAEPQETTAAAAPGERRGTERRKTERRTRAPRAAGRPAPAAPETDADGPKCKACGAGHEEGDWFCRKCGSRLF